MKMIITVILILAFLPITIPYIIWTKTNWSNKFKIGAIIGFFIFFIGVGVMSDSSTEPTASNTSSPSSELVTINRTPAPTKSPEELRIEKIERQFSAWDGSHIAVTRRIKEEMNDPKSYEHVKTEYIDCMKVSKCGDEDFITVITDFRGKNAFGGVVKNSVLAKVTVEGEIVSFENLQ